MNQEYVNVYSLLVSVKLTIDHSPKIVMETVAQASSLHGQDARPTVIDEKRTTLNSGETDRSRQIVHSETT